MLFLAMKRGYSFYVNHIFIWRTPDSTARTSGGTPVWEYQFGNTSLGIPVLEQQCNVVKTTCIYITLQAKW